MKKKPKTHKENVAEFVHSDEDLLNKLFEPAPEETEEIRTGPITPPFAEGKQKSIIYLSGINLILIDKMMRLANEGIKTKKKGKETKSSIINRVIENTFKNDPDAFLPKKED